MDAGRGHREELDFQYPVLLPLQQAARCRLRNNQPISRQKRLVMSGGRQERASMNAVPLIESVAAYCNRTKWRSVTVAVLRKTSS